MTARNRLLFAAAITLCSGALHNASAQNSVTIYGIVDVATVYSSNQGGASNTYMRSGNLAGSRIGFKGVEDLGGGTNAIFLLENGFNVDTGELSSTSSFFNRQAYVGLSNTHYGTLTAGRQYTPYYLFVAPIGPTTALTGATGAHPGDIDGLDTTIRSNNSVTYTSPVFNGLQFSGLVGFGETAGNMSAGRTLSAAVKYDYNAWNFALGYQRLNNGTTPGIWNSSASASFATSAINNGYLSADSAQFLAAAARYTIGKLVLGVNASNVEYRPNSGSLFIDKATFNTLGVLSTYQLTPALFVSAGYSYTKEKAANGITDPAKYHQVSLEQTYSFSPRTAIYFLEAYQIAKGQTLGLGGIGMPVRAVAVVGDSQNGTPSDGANQAVFMVGIRHSF